ncbi:hypothetical protein ACFQ4U_13450 [Micrococcus antarcticus]
MAGRIARTQTALRVADFLATREGKTHLSQYGWVPGMPIVMTRATESADDAMGMVSIHGRAALVAMLDPLTSELRILHITTPQPALKKVRVSPAGLTMGDLFEQLASTLIVELRVRFWNHTAVAHIIPSRPGMKNANDSWGAAFPRTQRPLETTAQAAALP